jgi:chemotaxis protein CheX
MSRTFAEGSEPIPAEIRDTLVESFLAATRAALAEMANTEVVVQAIHQNPQRAASCDISVVIGLAFATEGRLILSFPRQTAVSLASRMLTEVTTTLEEPLIRDCLGEISNVIAGQAKTLLAETQFQFAFSLPKFVSGDSEPPPTPGLQCLAIVFGSDIGEFTLQVFLQIPLSRPA